MKKGCYHYHALFPKQKEIETLIENNFMNRTPTLMELGQRSGKSHLVQGIAKRWTGPVVVIALTVRQARECCPVPGARYVSLCIPQYPEKALRAAKQKVKKIADTLNDKTLVIVEEAYWISYNSDFIQALCKETPFVIAYSSKGDNDWELKPNIGPFSTWEVNPEIKPEDLKHHYLEDYRKATRDFGKLPDRLIKKWKLK